jgi:hypothetical protein
MAKPIDQIMQKEMTRQEFLMTLGLGLASIMGFSTIIHLLTGRSVGNHLSSQQTSGYGSSPYGR